MTRATIDYIIMDTLANDLESMGDILRLANHPEIGWSKLAGGLIAESGVLLALPGLVDDGLVQVYVIADGGDHLEALPIGAQPSVSFGGCYFGLTSEGRLVHAGWGPPELE